MAGATGIANIPKLNKQVKNPASDFLLVVIW
jgi:hypothetical protein